MATQATFNVTTVIESDRFVKLFGQLLFAAADTYKTGGVSVVFNFATTGTNTAGLPVYLSGQTGLHATRPAQDYNVQVEGGAIAVVAPGTTAQGLLIKIYDSKTGLELANGAAFNTVPSAGPALSASVFHTLMLEFKKNI